MTPHRSAFVAALVAVLGIGASAAAQTVPKPKKPKPTPAQQREAEETRQREEEDATRQREAATRAAAAQLDEERGAFQTTRERSDRAKADNARADEAIRLEAEDRKSGIVALPNISYAPETAFVGGGYANYFVHFGDPFLTRPSTIELALAASTKRQFVGDLRTSLWLLDDALAIRAQIGAESFPNVYFGVGKHTLFSQAESFTSRDITSEEAVLVRVRPRVYIGARFTFDTRDIVDRDPKGELATNTVTGASGGTVLEVGPSLTYDSRDNVFATRRGTFAELVYKAAIPGVSDFALGQITAQGRQFVPVAGTVIAMLLDAQFRYGDTPWYLLSAMGGDALRGVFYGRFRDNNMIQAQAEWRFPIFGRWGGAIFGGGGTVARTVADFNPSDITPAAGAGLRYLLIKGERINIRVDAAYSPDGLLYYVNAGEAF